MRSFIAALLALLVSCTAGPDYERPSAPAPEAWKETGPWKEAAPSDAIAKGTWWELFGDPVLNDLELRAAAANQDLKAAVARVSQARAIARLSESEFYPTISLNPSATRTKFAEDRPVSPTVRPAGYTVNDFRVPLDLSYEVDVWGRVRRSVEAATAYAEASVASFETVRLTLHADVAASYFALRSIDSEQSLLRRTLELRREALRLAQTRLRLGVGNDLDVSRAETEVTTTEAEAIGLERRRAEIEHALAVLTGRPPRELSIPGKPLDVPPPVIPAGLPSELLERRPDVAEAERRLAASNAEIGIATAAYYPRIRLTAMGGFESSDLSSLFSWKNSIWQLGAAAAAPLFTGGSTRADVERARARYEESVAIYRQQLLVAFQEVEDGLSGLRVLAQQAEAQARAVASARRTATISNTRYTAGLVSYLEVVDAERTALQSERLATQIQGQRLVTSVFLIKALGGGWQGRAVTDSTSLKR
ncbi:MAG TPA: efflux transporter outer membrane subunit [Planctomycetota bacterium]|nr:efflux transporter outer membrane subunit [Planctomycetota bacterium]